MTKTIRNAIVIIGLIVLLIFLYVLAMLVFLVFYGEGGPASEELSNGTLFQSLNLNFQDPIWFLLNGN